MLSLRTRLSLSDKQACFEKGFASCVKKEIILKEDAASVKPYMRSQFERLAEAVETKQSGSIYELVEDDKAMREFYKAITGDCIEETGKKTLLAMLEETYVPVANPSCF